MTRRIREVLEDPRLIDVSWTDKPLYGFAKIVRTCEECGTCHRTGEHPDDECKIGTVDRVMNS